MLNSQKNKFETMKKILLFLVFIAAYSVCGAFTIESVRFHCDKDTVKINQLLAEALSNKNISTPGEYMAFFGNKLIGTPYVAHTLEGEKEYLTINIDELDCTTFVESLIALTRAAMSNAPTWYAYADNLEKIRYHDGKLGDYTSRLHYISAWVVENTSRGYVKEISSEIPKSETQIKSLNYMTQHRDSYPAMKNDSIYQGIKNLESGYNMHQFPYVNKYNLSKKEVISALQNGDIICLTTKIEGLDVTHLGIVQFQKGKPHLLNASSRKKEVTIDKYDLYEMLRNDRNCTGVRVIRVMGN